jgi:tetratricopeptide (TPR) repeat protein
MIGNVNEAINLYHSCIKVNPKCDVAYYELGTVYSALGENSKAEENLSMAYKLNNSNYWYGIAYSELLKINGYNSKSLEVLRKTRSLNQMNSLTIDFKISEIYSDEGKFVKALKVLENIEKSNGVSELISFKKFEIYKLQKKFDDAENVLLNLISKAPDVSEYHILLGEFLAEIGDTLLSLKAYENAFNIDTSNIFAITNLADLYSLMGDDEKAYFFLNQAFLNPEIPLKSKLQTMMYLNSDREMIKKNRVFVEEMITSLTVLYPEDIDVSTVAYDFYNGLENHSKALSIIKDILFVKKDDFIIWQQALYNASMLENYDEIILIGEEAIKYFPNKSELFLFLGMAYFQNENFSKSYLILSDAYRSIREGDQIKEQYLLFLSEAAYNSGNKIEAFNYFDILLEANPENNLIKNNYSYYLALDSINLIEAKEMSNQTLLSEPENSTFLDTYAWILFKLGDFNTARIYAEKALVINGQKDPDIIFHYAEILYECHELLLAEKFYIIAKDLGYSETVILEKLNRFEN